MSSNIYFLRRFNCTTKSSLWANRVYKMINNFSWNQVPPWYSWVVYRLGSIYGPILSVPWEWSSFTESIGRHFKLGKFFYKVIISHVRLHAPYILIGMKYVYNHFIGEMKQFNFVEEILGSRKLSISVCATSARSMFNDLSKVRTKCKFGRENFCAEFREGLKRCSSPMRMAWPDIYKTSVFTSGKEVSTGRPVGRSSVHISTWISSINNVHYVRLFSIELIQ